MEKGLPSPKEVELFHKNSDKDGSPTSIHHTLGNGPNQASPGDHTHDGGTSKELDLQQYPAPVLMSVGSASPPGTTYAIVGTKQAFTVEKKLKVLCTLEGLIRAQGTATNDITVKVITDGALAFDSSTDLAGYHGRLYHWASGTDIQYAKQSTSWTMDLPAGTTNFGIYAIRSANGTSALAGSLTLQITPLRLV